MTSPPPSPSLPFSPLSPSPCRYHPLPRHRSQHGGTHSFRPGILHLRRLQRESTHVQSTAEPLSIGEGAQHSTHSSLPLNTGLALFPALWANPCRCRMTQPTITIVPSLTDAVSDIPPLSLSVPPPFPPSLSLFSLPPNSRGLGRRRHAGARGGQGRRRCRG